MRSSKDEILEICYTIYNAEHKCSIDDFITKIINDEEFSKYVDDVLWKQAIKEYFKKRHNNV